MPGSSRRGRRLTYCEKARRTGMSRPLQRDVGRVRRGRRRRRAGSDPPLRAVPDRPRSSNIRPVRVATASHACCRFRGRSRAPGSGLHEYFVKLAHEVTGEQAKLAKGKRAGAVPTAQ